MLYKDFNNVDNHSPDCAWHKDWHACDCGIFDDVVCTRSSEEEQGPSKPKVAGSSPAWRVKKGHLTWMR